jgi:tRNA pseudouridine55 synthase
MEIAVGRRRRSGRLINGWINVNKPVGITSAACVNSVRHALDAAKLGHAGTLDPAASGVLPIALGEATKTMPFVVDTHKKYVFTVNWGEQRDTDDDQGEVIETANRRPDEAEIKAVLPQFTGEISQAPPTYSAIKVNGERAYTLARAGEDVILAPRQISILSFELLGMPGRDCARFAVTSGKGAYMRGLARDLAAALGTCGHLSNLRRCAVGPFTEETAISLDKLEELGHSAATFPTLLPIETALDGIPALDLSAKEALQLRNGQAVPVLRPQDRKQIEAVGDEGIVLAVESATPVALARVDGIQIRPVRVLNL